jgi:hypothetical protein
LVVLIKDGRVYYKPTNYCEFNKKNSFGGRNQMKVEFLGKAPKGRLRPERIKQVTL